MNCSEAISLIPLYCKGELSDELRQKLEEHLSACPTCSEHLNRERNLSHLLDDGASEDPPDEYWGDYNDRLLSQLKGFTAVVWRLGWLPCIAAVLIFGVIWGILAIALSSEHTSHLLRFLVMGIIGGISGIIGTLIFKFANKRGLPQYAKDEQELQSAVSKDPSTHTLFTSIGVVISLAMAFFIAGVYYYVFAKFLPASVRSSFASLVFIGYLALYVTSYYNHLTGKKPDLSTWHWTSKLGWLILKTLSWTAIAIMVLSALWYLYLSFSNIIF